MQSPARTTKCKTRKGVTQRGAHRGHACREGSRETQRTPGSSNAANSDAHNASNSTEHEKQCLGTATTEPLPYFAREHHVSKMSTVCEARASNEREVGNVDVIEHDTSAECFDPNIFQCTRQINPPQMLTSLERPVTNFGKSWRQTTRYEQSIALKCSFSNRQRPAGDDTAAPPYRVGMGSRGCRRRRSGNHPGSPGSPCGVVIRRGDHDTGSTEIPASETETLAQHQTDYGVVARPKKMRCHRRGGPSPRRISQIGFNIHRRVDNSSFYKMDQTDEAVRRYCVSQLKHQSDTSDLRRGIRDLEARQRLLRPVVQAIMARKDTKHIDGADGFYVRWRRKWTDRIPDYDLIVASLRHCGPPGTWTVDDVCDRIQKDRRVGSDSVETVRYKKNHKPVRTPVRADSDSVLEFLRNGARLASLRGTLAKHRRAHDKRRAELLPSAILAMKGQVERPVRTPGASNVTHRLCLRQEKRRPRFSKVVLRECVEAAMRTGARDPSRLAEQIVRCITERPGRARPVLKLLMVKPTPAHKKRKRGDFR